MRVGATSVDHLREAWKTFDPNSLPRLVRFQFIALKELCDTISASETAQQKIAACQLSHHFFDIHSWLCNVISGEVDFHQVGEDDLPTNVLLLVRAGQKLALDVFSMEVLRDLEIIQNKLERAWL